MFDFLILRIFFILLKFDDDDDEHWNQNLIIIS